MVCTIVWKNPFDLGILLLWLWSAWNRYSLYCWSVNRVHGFFGFPGICWISHKCFVGRGPRLGGMVTVNLVWMVVTMGMYFQHRFWSAYQVLVFEGIITQEHSFTFNTVIYPSGEDWMRVHSSLVTLLLGSNSNMYILSSSIHYTEYVGPSLVENISG